MKIAAFPTLSLAILLSGCATTGERRPGSAVEIQVEPSRNHGIESLAATPRGSVRPAASVVTGQPRLAPAPPPVLDEQPAPVWKDAEVVAVDMDAYVNERGELIAPSRKWVVRKQGGWNMDAARNPERAYVPSENVPAFPQAPCSYTPMVSPGSEFARDTQPTSPKNGIIGLAGVKQVRVLGYVVESDRSKAQTMVQPGEVLVLDKTLGFLAVPQAVLLQTPIHIPGNAGISSSARNERSARTIPDVTADEDVVSTKK